MPPITFTDANFQGMDHKQDDPMVINLEIKNFAVKKVDILYWATYHKLQIPMKAMIPYMSPFMDSPEKECVAGISTSISFSAKVCQTKTIPIRFLVVDTHTSYNVLFG